MIDKTELKRMGMQKGLKNWGHLEKDYLLDLFLHAISTTTKDELVFKGGTLLYKLYNMRRFSEDLDFTATKPIDIGKLSTAVLKILGRFGINGTLASQKEPYNSILLKFHLKGPLYTGTRNSLCPIQVDINLKSGVILPTQLKQYKSVYPDVPEIINLLTMNPTEVAAEKIRAIMTRDKARDIHDLYYLLRLDYTPDANLIEKKMNYYNQHWNPTAFAQKLQEKKRLWDKELKGLTLDLPPDFNLATNHILSKLHIH